MSVPKGINKNASRRDRKRDFQQEMALNMKFFGMQSTGSKTVDDLAAKVKLDGPVDTLYKGKKGNEVE